MPADFFGHRIFAVGEPVFFLDLRLQVVPVTITEVSCTQKQRRGDPKPEVFIDYLLEPRVVLAQEMRTNGRTQSSMVFATEEEAATERVQIIRDRYPFPATPITTAPPPPKRK